jgi:hypothetical protein
MFDSTEAMAANDQQAPQAPWFFTGVTCPSARRSKLGGSTSAAFSVVLLPRTVAGCSPVMWRRSSGDGIRMLVRSSAAAFTASGVSTASDARACSANAGLGGAATSSSAAAARPATSHRFAASAQRRR